MRSLLLCLTVFSVFFQLTLFADEPKVLVRGLEGASSIALDPKGKIYVTTIGEKGKDGDGAIWAIEDEKPVPVLKGLNDPRALVVFQDRMFVCDKQGVIFVGGGGSFVMPVAPLNGFPRTVHSLSDMVADPENGTLYICDSGDGTGKGGAIYRLPPRGNIDLVIDTKELPGLRSPSALAMDGASHLLMADSGTGILYRIRLSDRTVERVTEGLGAPCALGWDYFGRFFVGDSSISRIAAMNHLSSKPVKTSTKFFVLTDMAVHRAEQTLLALDSKAGTITSIPAAVPNSEVDHSALPLKTTVAFPDLQWKGWVEDEQGKRPPLRPIVLTHAGDGSGKIYVATQHGVIHSFSETQAETDVFLDIQSKVRYRDRENEEGFLGLAFHPDFKKNGEFYVFYTPTEQGDTEHFNVVSRFRTLKGDQTKGDPSSEEILLKVEHPFWNHDGGTIAFGPDGYLYIALGDGGLANDVYDNAQDPSNLLGSILRIDVNPREGGSLPYAIPKDNPFQGKSGIRPEIFAYGLRNVWRFSFDRKTNDGWIADVGQNLWEEIDILKKGANYGWNRREGRHPFGAIGTGPQEKFAEPIWEYNHDLGKSITGGFVYRGRKNPELDGYYIYADYVSGTVFALKYDAKQGRVVENRTIPSSSPLAVLSFGEDENGEVYALIASADGKGIYRFEK